MILEYSIRPVDVFDNWMATLKRDGLWIVARVGNVWGWVRLAVSIFNGVF